MEPIKVKTMEELVEERKRDRERSMDEMHFWFIVCTVLFSFAILWAAFAEYASDGDGYYTYRDAYSYGHGEFYHENGKPYTEKELNDLRHSYYVNSGYGLDWFLFCVSFLGLFCILPFFCVSAILPPPPTTVYIKERDEKNPGNVSVNQSSLPFVKAQKVDAKNV